MSGALKLRPVDPDDEPFLRALREEVDAERLGLLNVAPEDLEWARVITDMQFRAFSAHNQILKAHWDTKDCIIELDDQAVGRFIVTQGSEQVYLADIAVKREHRGKGLGHAVIDVTMAECIQSKRVLRLHVEPLNAALNFYMAMGFRIIAQEEAHYLMEWAPPALREGSTGVSSQGR